MLDVARLNLVLLCLLLVVDIFLTEAQNLEMFLGQQYKPIQKEDLQYPRHKHYLHQRFHLVYNKL
jgi:hypothetical protein